MFTKKEAACLTGLTTQQLDYWGKSVLQIVPESRGSKHSNVFYTPHQICELMLALSLKKQGFSNIFILGFVTGWRIIKRPVQNYIVTLEEISDFEKIGSVVIDIDKSQNRLIHSDEEGVSYLLVDEKELKKFVAIISNYLSKKVHIVSLPLVEINKEIRENAEKYNIDCQRLVA